MSYKDQLEKARKSKKLRSITTQIYKFEENGAEITGQVKEIRPFTGGKLEGKCNEYVLDTDNGLFSCILGSATDKSLKGIDLTGRVVNIVFHGQKILKNKLPMNVFEIFDLTDEK